MASCVRWVFSLLVSACETGTYFNLDSRSLASLDGGPELGQMLKKVILFPECFGIGRERGLLTDDESFEERHF